MKKWSMLYDAYKKSFDNELTLQLSKKRYIDIERENNFFAENKIDDVIPL